ncbi:hypothetical protein L0244_23685 [bacterium]|nr:hypothetical protein [bacterium]
MPFEVNTEAEEELVLMREYHGSKGYVFAFAVSNQAINSPSKKLFVKNFFERIPLSKVLDVSLRKLKPIFLYILAIIMIAVGAITTYWMMAPVLKGQGGDIKGYPIAIVVGGLVISFIARGRKALVVRMVDETYEWKPQLVVDSASRKQIASIQNEILEACKKVGIPTINAIH